MCVALARSACAALLAALACAASAARGPSPIEPFVEIEHVEVEGAAGLLVLPPGAGDRRAPVVVILHDGPDPDGRAVRYADQLLGAGYGVLEVLSHAGEAGAANAAAAARRLPFAAGQPLGVLGFGEGARLALRLPGDIAARAALYPGCEGVRSPGREVAGAAVLLLHGAADEANSVAACGALADRLAVQVAASDGTGAVRWLAYRHAGYAWDRPRYGSEGTISYLPRPGGEGVSVRLLHVSQALT